MMFFASVQQETNADTLPSSRDILSVLEALGSIRLFVFLRSRQEGGRATNGTAIVSG